MFKLLCASDKMYEILILFVWFVFLLYGVTKKDLDEVFCFVEKEETK